ncbi:PREDICTED: uncharacterized protein LOC109464808 [Branchiostoma belcheri]|uniref:Uncharacterized protein LOC109464808 n=1 Tax=Branchiostoma belcheri TaxID=7741 RepID=A0A6P4XLI0_BRABE|nr:PREDICTED: uncharacterized protein LOC109464808 [Branchiostoma belcheri]
MDFKHLDLLDQYQTVIVNSLPIPAFTAVLEELFFYEVITDDEQDYILSSPSREERVNDLVDIMKGKDDDDFYRFRKALQETGCDHLANLLHEEEQKPSLPVVPHPSDSSLEGEDVLLMEDVVSLREQQGSEGSVSDVTGFYNDGFEEEDDDQRGEDREEITPGGFENSEDDGDVEDSEDEDTDDSQEPPEDESSRYLTPAAREHWAAHIADYFWDDPKRGEALLETWYNYRLVVVNLLEDEFFWDPLCSYWSKERRKLPSTLTQFVVHCVKHSKEICEFRDGESRVSFYNTLGQKLQSLPSIQNMMQVSDLSQTADLVMSFRELTDQDITALCRLFYLMADLKVMEVDGNKFTGKGALAIAQTLRHVPNLERFNINGIKVRDAGARALVTKLCLLENLLHVEFSGCGLSEKAGVGLGSRIKDIANLEVLNLGCNSLGDDAASELAQSFAKTTKMQKVYLHYNRITSDGALSVVGSLKNMPELRQFGIGGNLTTATCLSAFSDYIEYLEDYVDLRFFTIHYTADIQEKIMEMLKRFINKHSARVDAGVSSVFLYDGMAGSGSDEQREKEWEKVKEALMSTNGVTVRCKHADLQIQLTEDHETS